MRPRVYLAGPDVFLADAAAVLAAKAKICDRHGLEALSPLDNEIGPAADDPALAPTAIYGGNRAQMDAADAVIADLTPFRGVSADVGTAFELGYCAARQLPLFGYSSAAEPYASRVRMHLGLPAEAAADESGMSIEDFGHADNLMLIEAIRASGGLFFDASGARADADPLQPFERCARELARLMRASLRHAV